MAGLGAHDQVDDDQEALASNFLSLAQHLSGSFFHETVAVRLRDKPAVDVGEPRRLEDLWLHLAELIARHGRTHSREEASIDLPDAQAFSLPLVLRVLGAGDGRDWPVWAFVTYDGRVLIRFYDLTYLFINWQAGARGLRNGQPSLRAGAVFLGSDGGPYIALDQIGRGGTAVVYRVRSPTCDYAAKCLSPGRFAASELIPRFQREVRHLRELPEHPHVVRFVDSATIDGDTVLVIELAESALIDRLDSGPVALDVALDWVDDALSGLAHLHDHGLVHRDVSPRNLMFVNGRLKVGDFGTVRSESDPDFTTDLEKAHLGSLVYIPHEQRATPHTVTSAADVFAAGQVAYQLLTGLAPIGNPPPLVGFPDVPGDVASVIEGMRSYDREARPQTARQALAEFRRARAA